MRIPAHVRVHETEVPAKLALQADVLRFRPVQSTTRSMIKERRSLKANRGGSSVGFVAVLAVAVVGGGLYLASKNPERLPVPVPSADNLVQVAALARAEKDAEWLQRATRERQAIIGMTYREVEMAKGKPATKQRGETLPPEDRAKGGVENWLYNLEGGQVSAVLFGTNGVVVYSSDVGETPGPGQVIRK